MFLLWVFSTLLQIVGLLTLVLILLIVYRLKLRPTPPIQLIKKDWEKNVVYLFQFPLCPTVRTISPFALKLETWLKLTGIKYENVFTMKFGSKGQIPYIELNGEQIPDSNIIINVLKEKFNVDPDEGVSEGDLAVGHAATMMLEHHTAHIGFHYRYGHHMQNFLDTLQLAEYYPSAKHVKNWGRVQPYLTRFRSWLQGIGRHENAELWEMSFKDLRSLSNLLGTKAYFLGAQPTSVDCTIFGHLAQFLFIDIGFPQKTFMENNCSNLVELVDRMKKDFWPDWDESIEAARNDVAAERLA